MEWIEADRLPKECEKCEEQDCYNCDVAGKRWTLSHTDELRLRKKSLLKAIERMQRQVKAIDAELESCK